ncbi:MAG: D-alanyl-D-alanine carboxypeptidase/D-alanyl-D-alanine-endopeptidase, partial [Candidatus Kapaibacterium sp.]
RVTGTVREGMAPTGARTVAEFRRPLTELLYPVNKNSDNFVAEHVMKIVGATCCGNTMCSVNAFKTVASILDSASVPHTGCVLYDGSGLSRRNKTAASTQVYMLKSIAEQPFALAFMNTMAIAGVDGTVRRRMLGTNAVGNVHAKTGTHSSVSALSGYVRSKDGERFCFSIIGNGLPAGVLKQMENACVIQLAEFSAREGTVSWSKPRR